MSGLLRRHWILIALFVAIIAPWVLGSYQLNLLSRFLAMAILAVGLSLLWGEAGILPLGQGVFFGLGGYALAMHLKLVTLSDGDLPDFMTWSGRTSLPFWWVPFQNGYFAVAMVFLVPLAAGALIAWLVFRRRVGGVYFALITQAAALCFATLLISQQPLTGGFNGLTDYQTLFGFDLSDDGTIHALYWITLVLLAAAYAGTEWLMAGRYGTMLRAIREGENRMRFLGHNPTPYKVVAFALAAMMAGVAGALFTLHAGVVSPALVGVVPSIEMVIWVAIGGRQSRWGAIVGTLIVNFAKDEVSSAFPSIWSYALGGLFVLSVTLLPKGIAGIKLKLPKAKLPQAALKELL